MIKNIKKIAALLSIFAFAVISFSAKEATFEGDDYLLRVQYNDIACPGDAVYLRMTFFQTTRKNHITQENFKATTAVLSLSEGDKKLRHSDFFAIQSQELKGRTGITLLAGLPLSSWWKPEELNDLHLTITYTLYGDKTFEFDLPFKLSPKDFVSETIPLDDQNTAIKTDTSTARQQQIEKLNAILFASNKDSVFNLTPFKMPTTITRRTSFFADRRVYAYSNGKSSTSLHYGIDFGCPRGTNVTSCGKGKVVLAENRITTGWSVVVEHLPGLYSLYYHMDELKVEVGQTVNPGDLIGLSGCTGLATGPHLHWEVRLNGEAVNPEFFLTNFCFEP